MKKYLLAVVVAVSPAMAFALTLDGIEGGMEAANNAAAAGNVTKAHELASIIDGVGINEGGVNAVFAQNNSGGKLVSAGALKKTNLAVIPSVPGKKESGLTKMLKSDKAEGSVWELVGTLIGLAIVVAIVLAAVALIAGIAMLPFAAGAVLVGGIAAKLGLSMPVVVAAGIVGGLLLVRALRSSDKTVVVEKGAEKK